MSKGETIIDRLMHDEVEDGVVEKLKMTKRDHLLQFVKESVPSISLNVPEYGKYDLMELQKYHDCCCEDDDYDRYIMLLHGGENGTGDWRDYLNHLNVVINQLSTHYHVTVIKIDNDVPDDVHYVYLSLYEK